MEIVNGSPDEAKYSEKLPSFWSVRGDVRGECHDQPARHAIPNTHETRREVEERQIGRHGQLQETEPHAKWRYDSVPLATLAVHEDARRVEEGRVKEETQGHSEAGLVLR